MKCPGSIQLIASLPSGALTKAGPEAAKGTAAHTLCETCLTTDTDAWEHTGTTINVGELNFVVDENMTTAVQVYVDFIRQIIAENPGTYYVEKRLRSKLHPQAFGTADFILLGPGVIIVIDYKHGEGVVVEPNKAQLRYYGYMGYETFRSEVDVGTNNPRVVLYIVQPRIPHPKGPIRKHEETGESLVSWFTDVVVPAMRETENPDALLQIGEHCRFCPAKNHCPAMRSEAVSFKASGPTPTLTEDEIADLMVRGKALVKFVKSIEEEAFRRAQSGKRIPGYKLVHKQASRSWKGEEAEKAVAEKFGDDAFTKPVLKSPAEIEKMPGGKAVATRWASKPLTGLTLAPEEDSRPETKPISELFDEFEQSNIADALTA